MLSHAERVALIDPAHDMSIAHQAKLLDISRSSVYTVPVVSEADLALMNAIDRIYTDLPFYGSRRMVHALKDRFGLLAGRHKIRRLEALMGIETAYAKPRTSVAHPENRTYPYLLRNVTADHPNHIWGTDITYIPLKGGFCYLVALIDWYSRFVVAWTLSPTLEIEFCIENLKRALLVATPDIHNSDQGSHFTSIKYTGPLIDNKVQISMDGKGRCMDNILVERFWRTVKYEDVYLRGYATFAEVEKGLANFMTFYNEKRRHSSLENRTPKEVYGEKKKTEIKL